jgi:ADP-ribose pyrophosphatase YjhB (NUDIX family)
VGCKPDLALAVRECQRYDPTVRRELSAGGVVVRRLRGGWYLAAIRPAGKTGVWALPKGNLGPGEKAAEAASREIYEETGLETCFVQKLGDVRYVYTWDGERIFKIVSFYLFRYRSGRLGDVGEEHAHEVAEARWLRLDRAPTLLSYRGEKEMAQRAWALLASDENPL